MCCRYYTDDSPLLRPFVEEMNRSPLLRAFGEGAAAPFPGEVRPFQVAPALATGRAGRRAVFPMRWGFRGKSLLINARTETAGEKPLFREAWAGHRCALPASGYFEWEHTELPDGKRKTGSRYRFRRPEGELIWLCGLYRLEGGLPCFVILTREPGESVRPIHDRMPLILPEEAAREWVRPESRPEELLPLALTRVVPEKG